MLVQVKPHSLFKKHFNGEDLTVDLDQYTDLFNYIHAMHPLFVNFAKNQVANNYGDGFVLLDKDLKEISIDDVFIRKVKENDVVHIVPTITGGGGKAKSVFGILAGVALLVVSGGAAAPLLIGNVGAIGSAGVAGSALSIGGVSLAAIGKNIAVNLILAGFSKLFAKKPKDTDAATRENGMFSGLANSTSSDTPIALHYGLVRVAGQFISGYILSTEHDKNAVIEVGDSFD